MGLNSKIMVGTTSRVWREGISAYRAIERRLLFRFRLPETLGTEPRAAWRGRDSHRLPGRQSRRTDAKSALDIFTSGLTKMSPKMGESLDPDAVTSWFWYTYPFTLGSYASSKVGQYTTHVGGGAGARLAWTTAICRRANGWRFHWLYERWCLERQSRRCGSDQDDGTAQESKSGTGLLEPAIRSCFPVALGPALD